MKKSDVHGNILQILDVFKDEIFSNNRNMTCKRALRCRFYLKISSVLNR